MGSCVCVVCARACTHTVLLSITGNIDNKHSLENKSIYQHYNNKTISLNLFFVLGVRDGEGEEEACISPKLRNLKLSKQGHVSTVNVTLNNTVHTPLQVFWNVKWC